MGDIVELVTWPKQKHVFYEVNTGAICVEIKGHGDAIIGLSKTPSPKCDYWVTIGENNNQKCVISMSTTKQNYLTIPNTLSPEAYRTFVISWHDDIIRLQARSVNPPKTIFITADIDDIKYVTFTVPSNNTWPVYWRVEMPPQRPMRPLKMLKGGAAPRWVSSTEIDQLPDDAFVGGFETEVLYIIRAKHRGSLTPGKFVPSNGVGFIAWGGTKHPISEFEVLCGHDFIWSPGHDDIIPVNAVLGGHSEQAEPLYIGRAQKDGRLIPGKVQPSHKCCYIPYKHQEISVTSYEVLVSPFSDTRAAHSNMFTAFKNLPSDIYHPDPEEDGDSSEEDYAF